MASASEAQASPVCSSPSRSIAYGMYIRTLSDRSRRQLKRHSADRACAVAILYIGCFRLSNGRVLKRLESFAMFRWLQRLMRPKAEPNQLGGDRCALNARGDFYTCGN